MWKRLIPAFLFPALLILLPILLRQETQQNSPEGNTDILVAVSPHTEPIKYEFERAFRKYYKEQTGRDIRIDWRSLGGTNDITRYVEDRFTAEFRLAWLEKGNEYNNTVEKAFKDPKSESAARKFFLDSQLGIGVDIFFGGGSYEHNNFAKKVLPWIAAHCSGIRNILRTSPPISPEKRSTTNRADGSDAVSPPSGLRSILTGSAKQICLSRKVGRI